MMRHARPWAIAILAILFAPVYTSAMGLTYVDVTLKPISNGRAGQTLRCLVDTGATDSLVSGSKLREIGVQPAGKRKYELADGTIQEYPFGFAWIEFMGEMTTGRVIFGPDGTEAILGVTALESAGYIVDPVNLTLKKLPAIPLK